MDCEKFDRIVLDLLYEELDELTSAAAKRHMEHCSRCRGIGSGLRATRQLAVLPLEEAPAGLSERILQGERRAHAGLPLRQRFGRAISVMAGYAMRPQLAMAALLLLMIGTSLLLLRARPVDSDMLLVTERGVPESEAESMAIVKLPESESAAAAPAHGAMFDDPAATSAREEVTPAATEPLAGGPPSDAAAAADGGVYEEAMAAYRSGRYGEAQRLFAQVAAEDGDNAPSAALLAAQAARTSSGCREAAPMFDRVTLNWAGSPIAHEAAWQAADCYRSLGQPEDARRQYRALLDVAGYSERARSALASLDQTTGEVFASRKAASGDTAESKPKTSAPARARPAAKPATPPPVNASKETGF